MFSKDLLMQINKRGQVVYFRSLKYAKVSLKYQFQHFKDHTAAVYFSQPAFLLDNICLNQSSSLETLRN